LTLLKTSFLARPQNLGRGAPFISAYVPSAPILLAQSAIFLFRPVVSCPIAVSFSYIFYHTLGTVQKKVGLQACKNLTKLPCKAVGSVKKTFAPTFNAITKSTSCAAT